MTYGDAHLVHEMVFCCHLRWKKSLHLPQNARIEYKENKTRIKKGAQNIE